MKIRKNKFPLCLQHDSMQCGVACLQMICKYYGKDYSTDTLSHYCFTTNQGVSLLGISEAAEQLGFDTRLMGDLIQRMNDHSRVEKFLTNQTLNVVFSLLSFFIHRYYKSKRIRHENEKR